MHLFSEGKFSSFLQLVNTYKIPNSQFFCYLQIRHMVSTLLNGAFAHPDALPLETLLKDTSTNKGLLSKIYVVLLEHSPKPLEGVKWAGESNLQIQISEEDWKYSCGLLCGIFVSNRHRLAHFKVLHRTYFTTTKLCKMDPMTSLLCPKCHCAKGSLVHLLWACPKVLPFWVEVVHTLLLLLDCDLPALPEYYLLNLPIPDLTLEVPKKKFLNIAITVAKLTVARHWWTETAPFWVGWIQNLLQCMELEKIWYAVERGSLAFHKIWHPFHFAFESGLLLGLS
nr:PREDICTED: uncharacterized protein LOC106702622 [Latimeria chalumnae]|eukprot:XP_014340886.1 PREDICTED: uncharacterized protein LOC106702622 [Latimeria chalumnae]